MSAVPGQDDCNTTTVENAVREAAGSPRIARLAGNWHRRAAVKRQEPDLDALFEPGRADYPERILPFADHPTYRDLPDPTKAEILSWAWIAYNRQTVVAEQEVANPAFALVMSGAFPGATGEKVQLAMAQAMVDEQYHTLMHLSASAVTRRRRGRPMPDDALPLAYTARRHRALRAACSDRWERAAVTLAFATVSEISINAYLDLLADDPDIQPINSSTARLHNRDEYCHADISSEVAKSVYLHLPRPRQEFFLRMLGEGFEAFVANDYGTWSRIVALVGVPGGRQMLDDCRADAGRARLVRDYTGLWELCQELDVTDRVDFDWTRSRTPGSAAR